MRLGLALFASLLANSALAADPNAVVDRFTDGLTGLDGRFEQEVLGVDGELKERSSGTIALQVPRQLRWEYLEPFPQTIVADGEHLFVFDPDLEQVTVRRQLEEEQQSPLLALVDPEERDRQFTLKDGGQREGLDWIELESKLEEAPIERARLAFSGAELVRMDFSDSLGQSTRVRFSGWQRNPDFADGTFRFLIPAGVDVVGDYSPAAQITPLGE
jgi:outer membrane lipoprotein carrier protein